MPDPNKDKLTIATERLPYGITDAGDGVYPESNDEQEVIEQDIDDMDYADEPEHPIGIDDEPEEIDEDTIAFNDDDIDECDF